MESMKTKILLYVTHENEKIYLTKHLWNCGWYWSLGYLGNKDCHFHFNSLFSKGFINIEKEFKDCALTQQQFDHVVDMFKRCYALKSAAEVYVYGGHYSRLAGTTDILCSIEKAKQLNNDLEKLLDKLWSYIETNAKQI